MCYDISSLFTPFSLRLRVTWLSPCLVRSSPFPSHRDPRTLPSAFRVRSIYDVAKICKLPQYRFSSSRTELVSNPKKKQVLHQLCTDVSDRDQHFLFRRVSWLLP